MPYILPSNSKTLVYRYGERGSGFRPSRKDGVQDFQKIQEKLKNENKLYKDEEFPAEDSSIFFGRASELKDELEKAQTSVVWRRPPDISECPQFITDGASRFDVNQGSLGDCWLISAIAVLPLNQSIFDQVVPNDNTEFDPTAGYCGAFHFRFWQYGRWVDVTIDDRLPTTEDGQLIFMKSEDPNEYWSCLLEKAYAKLNGSYEALVAGFSFEALEDFTGGVVEFICVNEKEEKFEENTFDILKKAHERSSFMGCSINDKTPEVEEEEKEIEEIEDGKLTEDVEREIEDTNGVDPEENDIEGDDENKEEEATEVDDENKVEEATEEGDEVKDSSEKNEPIRKEAKDSQGLYAGHAYSITDVRSIEIERGSGLMVPLIRIRNPWGQESEWEGAWSDASKLWESISDEVKEEMELTFDADGEFWMSFEDFREHFHTIEIVHLTAASMDEQKQSLEEGNRKQFSTHLHEGAWIRGVTAGGPSHLITIDEDSNEEEETFLESFALNPQYIFKIQELDDSENCVVIIALMQKNRRAQIEKFGLDEYGVGLRFHIYKIEESEDEIPKPLPPSFFQDRKCDWDSGDFESVREICQRFELPQGSFVIVPFTDTIDKEAEFIIRVFTESKINVEVNEDSNIRIEDIENEEENEIDEDETKRLEKYFRTVAGTTEADIDFVQLSKVLEYSFRGEFELENLTEEVCRLMVASVDVDKTGKVNLAEFFELWKMLKQWTTTFRKHDQDHSGQLNSSELRPILASIGCHVPFYFLQSILLRYGNRDRQISFGTFISIALKLKALIGVFRERDQESSGIVSFTLDQWIEASLFG